MKKHLLLVAAAVPAMLFGTAAMAQEHGDGESSLELDLRYANNIDTSVTTDVTYTKDVALEGTVTMNGNIEVDSSAVAVNDVKQIQALSTVQYREENELNGENGYVDPVFGPGVSEHGMNPGDGLTDGVAQPQIRAGFFAPIINKVDEFDVSGAGNIGVNIAAGYYNMQMNSAALAVSSSDSPNKDDGGWAEASTTSFQSLLGTTHYATPGDVLDEDDPENGGGSNNYRDRNSVWTGSISGDGNIGVNAAAGAFNQQANLLTLAVATDSSLAEANAGLVQTALGNGTEQQDSINYANVGTVSGTGNIGVNVAAGVGNQQLNSLTIATSSGGGDGQGGGGIQDPS